MAAASDQTLRRVASATLDQLEHLLPAEGGRTSPHLPPSTARDQCGQILFLLTDALQTLSCGTNTRPGSLSDHLIARQQAESSIRELTRSVVGSDPAFTLVPQAEHLIADLRSELASTTLPAVVDSLFGTVRLVDYLRGVLIESVASALRFRCQVMPKALTEATRALTAVLGARYPGAAIEVRVPPAAAVQLGAFGAGPSHTRGTPPNVIEMDPTTFVALATGTKDWARELAEHRVSASGAQIDALARMLPVITLVR